LLANFHFILPLCIFVGLKHYNQTKTQEKHRTAVNWNFNYSKT